MCLQYLRFKCFFTEELSDLQSPDEVLVVWSWTFFCYSYIPLRYDVECVASCALAYNVLIVAVMILKINALGVILLYLNTLSQRVTHYSVWLSICTWWYFPCCSEEIFLQDFLGNVYSLRIVVNGSKENRKMDSQFAHLDEIQFLKQVGIFNHTIVCYPSKLTRLTVSA